MMLYKFIVVGLCIVILDRCLIPLYMDRLKDFYILELCISALIIENFQHFNQIIIFSLATFYLIILIDLFTRSRIGAEQQEELRLKMTELQFTNTYLMKQLEELESLYKDLQQQQTDVYDSLYTAVHMLYKIPYTDDLVTMHEQCTKIAQTCIDLYKQPVKLNKDPHYIFDDLSTPREIRHYIRELKRLKKDNLMGENFDKFLEQEINFLEVTLQRVNQRTNNKQHRSKQYLKRHTNKRKS